MTTTSLQTRRTLDVAEKTYTYFSIPAAEKAGLGDVSRLPYSLKVLLENLLRYLELGKVTIDDINALATWLNTRSSQHEITFQPTRVLMQDFTGVPAVVDLATMRDAMSAVKHDPQKINPQIPVDLVIDHSVQVDQYANSHAFLRNVEHEMARNRERYAFLRWGQSTFENFRVVPPGTGICHQVNLEYLANVIWQQPLADGSIMAYPDSLVGTDSHTTMVNGLGVLGWGVGGIEAEAAMLGQPITMTIPEVVGVKLVGKLREGIIATDLVLTITEMLRQHGVVGKFVEFYGPGLNQLPLADRATIANMAPEYGATCGFFPVDQETIDYLHLTGRDETTIALVEAYAKTQGLWRDDSTSDPLFTHELHIDLDSIESSLAGPKRPQDRVTLSGLQPAFEKTLSDLGKAEHKDQAVNVEGQSYQLHHGDIVIAAITSCTNTSNPSALIAAALLAKNAIDKGLQRKPWVKSSLAPGSKVVTDYLAKADLQQYLDALGFHLVGYGCTTCIGNSGPLDDHISLAIDEGKLAVCSVLSGNRNFEGRIHPQVKANWLASPPLVVAYALAGTVNIDMSKDPIGQSADGQDLYLRDLWPSQQDINAQVQKVITREIFIQQYADVFTGDDAWQNIHIAKGQTYQWDDKSTYIQRPPFFENLQQSTDGSRDIHNAQILALLGDSITTDHISPAGAIKSDSAAGEYLKSHGVSIVDFNSFGSRRGNHEVMMRGTFGNIRIRNEMVPGKEGGITRHYPSGEEMSIYDAAMRYKAEHIPLVVIAGKEYGTGSSRDWAAKGTYLLGVQAVIAESFERIHRSNLIGMGVLPLEFTSGSSRKSLELFGNETIDLYIPNQLSPKINIQGTIKRVDGSIQDMTLTCRIDTQDELEYYCHGGILHYVLHNLSA